MAERGLRRRRAASRLQADIDGVRSAAAPVQAANAGPDPADNVPRIPVPEVRTLSEAITPKRPRLVIFGAGHIGQAVARAFAPLPFHLDWLASRGGPAP